MIRGICQPPSKLFRARFYDDHIIQFDWVKNKRLLAFKLSPNGAVIAFTFCIFFFKFIAGLSFKMKTSLHFQGFCRLLGKLFSLLWQRQVYLFFFKPKGRPALSLFCNLTFFLESYTKFHMIHCRDGSYLLKLAWEVLLPKHFLKKRSNLITVMNKYVKLSWLDSVTWNGIASNFLLYIATKTSNPTCWFKASEVVMSFIPKSKSGKTKFSKTELTLSFFQVLSLNLD